LLDVVFVDFDEYKVSSNGNGTQLAAARPVHRFVSDNDSPDSVKIAMRAGAQDFLVRPFDA